MTKVLRDWTQRYFSDEEAMVLVIILVLDFSVTLAFGGMLAPVLTTTMIAFLIQGMVGMLECFRMPHLFVVWLVYSLSLGLLTLFLVVLLPLFRQQLFTLFNKLPRMLSEWRSVLPILPERYPSLINKEQMLKVIETARGGSGQIGQWVLTSSLANLPAVANVMIYLVLVPIPVFFFPEDRERFHTWFHRYLPHECGLMKQIWAEMNQQTVNYIRGEVIEIVITDAVIYITFAYLGFNCVALPVLLIGLSVVVPYIGVVAVSVPVAMIAFSRWGWSDQFTYLMAAHTIIQALDGNMLVPLPFSEVVNLHPVAIICTVLLLDGF